MILTRSLPHNQSFKQYLHIFLLIALCLRHTLSTIKRRLPTIEIPATISLLVLVPSRKKPGKPFCSLASIGFSACGRERKDIINDRKQIIPELGNVELRNGHPTPGNCSEVDNLCHLDEFVSLVRAGSEECKRIVAVTSTLNLMKGNAENNCPACWKLIKLVRQKHKFLHTFVIAPGESSAGI